MNPDSLNLAQVANRLLDIGEKGAVALSQKIQEIAPKAWEIAMRQVINEVIIDLFTTILGIIISLVIIYIGIRIYQKNQYSGHEIGFFIVGGSGGGGSLIAFFICLNTCVKVIANPEYYAIQKLIEMATGH